MILKITHWLLFLINTSQRGTTIEVNQGY